MTKFSKKPSKNALFQVPFGPNISKSEISANIRLSFLKCKNNASSLKKSEEN